MHSIRGFVPLLGVIMLAGAAMPAAPSGAGAQMKEDGGASMTGGHGGAADHAMTPPGADAHPFKTQMDADMAKMMHDMHAPGYTGNWDVDFLAMMIPHHQGAIDMAELVIAHGKDPAVRRLAEEIITAQQEEIAFMTKHLETLRHGSKGAAMPGHKNSQ